MSNAAQISANHINAQSSTGPRTEEGKSNSSQNATRHGLFTQGDFVRPGEEAAYQILVDALDAELRPEGILEGSHVAEIRRATWRLARCADAEGDIVTMLTPGSDSALDAIRNETIAKLQNSIDRARSQAHRLLTRATAELRRLQTERHYRTDLLPGGADNSSLGLCDYRSVIKGLAERDLWQAGGRKLTESDDMRALLQKAERHRNNPHPVPPQTPSAERTQSAAPIPSAIARNALCPCNSGRKYKRCCGENAPAILHAA
jgi:hypothetical protein